MAWASIMNSIVWSIIDIFIVILVSYISEHNKARITISLVAIRVSVAVLNFRLENKSSI